MNTETIEIKETEYNLASAKKLVAGLAAEAAALKKAGRGNVSEAVSDWLAAQYLMVLHARLQAKGDEPGIARRWETLRTGLMDWTRLRRGDQATAWLALDREELEMDWQNSLCRREKEFKQWMKDPKVREKYFPKSQGGITQKTLEKIEKELGLL